MLTKKTLLIGSFSESILYTEGIVDSNRAVGIAGSNNSAGNLGALLFIIALFNLYKKRIYFLYLQRCLLFSLYY